MFGVSRASPLPPDLLDAWRWLPALAYRYETVVCVGGGVGLVLSAIALGITSSGYRSLTGRGVKGPNGAAFGWSLPSQRAFITFVRVCITRRLVRHRRIIRTRETTQRRRDIGY